MFHNMFILFISQSYSNRICHTNHLVFIATSIVEVGKIVTGNLAYTGAHFFLEIEGPPVAFYGFKFFETGTLAPFVDEAHLSNCEGQGLTKNDLSSK